MRDPRAQGGPGRPAFEGFDRYSATLIVVSGPEEGEEHRIDRPRWVVGRGPDVDAAFDDPEMSQQHSAIEFARGRFHVTDLDSTNGTQVNGTGVVRSELVHGDRIRLGRHVFQILIENDGPFAGYMLPSVSQRS